MHKWVRHCASLMAVLCFIFVVHSCASGKKSKSRIQRQAIVDYEIVRVSSKSPDWIEDFYLNKAKNPDQNQLISIKEEPEQNRWVFIVDSGARHDEKVACTMVRAQGREQIAEAVARRLHQKVSGRPYDVLVLGPGLKKAYEILGNTLTAKSVVDEFVEGRVFPGSPQIKEVRAFHCALKIELSYEVIIQITNEIKELIRKDYYYRSSLEEELEDLSLI